MPMSEGEAAVGAVEAAEGAEGAAGGADPVTAALLELQAVDTLADQLRHRLANLPELVAANQARQDLMEWDSTGTALRARQAALAATIEAAESESAEIDRHRARLEAQLRTVIAPREAEALQHEIAGLQQRRSDLDDVELAALEEQAAIDDTLSTHAGAESSLREATNHADAALGAAQADIGAQLGELEVRRQVARPAIGGLVGRYDRLREQLGVAVARLVGRRCDGCHLDLSVAEADAIKALPAGELADCPQCGRLLVR